MSLLGSMTPVHIYFRFRWVDCQLGYLRHCLPGRIRRTLNELPETLDGTYERVLRDIHKARWEVAQRLLQIVSVASRPLRVEELAQVLGFDFTGEPIPKFQPDWLLEDPIDAVLSTTSSLLEIVDDGGLQVIQFSHFSVKEFLTSSRLAEASDVIRRYHISMTEAHALAAQACLGMLLHLAENITRDELDKFPLSEYAAGHWVDHAQFEGVSLKVEDGMKRLFDPNNVHFAIWVWIHDLEDRYWRREKRGERPSAPRGAPLHYASLCGLDAIVKFLVIDHSQTVNSRGFDDESTALHLAARRGYAEIARFLLDNGADVNARDKRKSTPLHEASTEGHAEVVRVLMEHGVDITARNDAGNHPVILAFAWGRVEVSRVFLEFGVDPMGNDINGWPPLHRALYEGHIDMARALLENGADISRMSEGGITPLFAASFGGHVTAIRVLIECGLDMTTEHGELDLLLQMACVRGQVEVARLFLEHGADVTARMNDNFPPLHIAIALGHVELVPLLLEHGADVNTRDKNGETPLDGAAQIGCVKTAQLLLERGANVEARDSGGLTPLHTAAIKGHVELACLLLDCGADATVQDNSGRTPLHIAEAEGHVELTHLLLKRGTNAPDQADYGRVPTHITGDREHVEPPRLLPDGGTDGIAQADDYLHQIAMQSLAEELRELMEPLGLVPSPGINAGDRADDGRTSIRVAVSEECSKPASLLPEPRAAVTAQAGNELPPLNDTAAEGHVDYTPSLRKLGPGLDPTTHADDGQTPLRTAPQGVHEDVARVLPNHGAEAIVHDDQRWRCCIVQ